MEQRAESVSEVERLRDLVRRLLPGWGSDEDGCDPDGYAAYKEAVNLVADLRAQSSGEAVSSESFGEATDQEPERQKPCKRTKSPKAV